jgi:hypothetical protein
MTQGFFAEYHHETGRKAEHTRRLHEVIGWRSHTIRLLLRQLIRYHPPPKGGANVMAEKAKSDKKKAATKSLKVPASVAKRVTGGKTRYIK